MKHLDSSFRDQSGYIFEYKNEIFRCINKSYSKYYDLLISSGLYESLVEKQLLISHDEVSNLDEFNSINKDILYKVIKPKKLPFISYPYEWSFNQLKDAAILTLEVLLEALSKNMILKDASAYNVQFLNGKPVFIDTLSFEEYVEGNIWNAYTQFCKHFLAPLSLIVYKDYRLHKESINFLDGLPLDFTSQLLPTSTKFNLNLFMHIHLNAKVHKKAENDGKSNNKPIFLPKQKLVNMILNLLSTIKSLNYKPKLDKSSWKGYYSFTNYNEKSFNEKENLVLSYVLKCGKKEKILDIGANNGYFSRIISNKVENSIIISSDIDFHAVDENYISIDNDINKNIYPVITDLTNPISAIGWANKERLSFLERVKNSDIVLALALIHHISITNNVPFIKVSELFASITKYLIIEYVPKDDSQTIKILDENLGDYSYYNEENFENSFKIYFKILDKQLIPDTKRTLYLMEKLVS